MKLGMVPPPGTISQNNSLRRLVLSRAAFG
jgi:hypothetical protein